MGWQARFSWVQLNGYRTACSATLNSLKGHQRRRGGYSEKYSVLGKKVLAIHATSIYTNCMRKSTEIASNPTASIESSLPELEQQHRALLAELAYIGLVLRGSIALRLCICGNPKCRCRANPPVLHGPYYKWTRKVAGKTVNATLTPEQAPHFNDWNQNMRKLDRIVEQLQDLGLRAATLLLKP